MPGDKPGDIPGELPTPGDVPTTHPGDVPTDLPYPGDVPFEGPTMGDVPLEALPLDIQDDIDIARYEQSDLPPCPSPEGDYKTYGKSGDMLPDDNPVGSGYTGSDDNRWAKEAWQHAKDIGHPFLADPRDPDWPNGEGVGMYNACHTEAKLFERMLEKGVTL